ncbi:MAG TPA: amino acid adenylation domain-containing protein [Noviherbaspirillum sp.]
MSTTPSIALFISELRKLGIELSLDGEHLDVTGRTDLLTADLVDGIRARKPELIRFLSAARAAPLIVAGTAHAAHTVDSEQRRPCSFAQRRLWFLDQMEPGSAFYNMPLALRLRGGIDAAMLEKVLADLVARHASLRTRFDADDGTPVQVIAPSMSLPLKRHDLKMLDAADREAKGRQLAQDEMQAPFNLETGPLIRAGLIELAADEHIFLLTLHHIISDGWSMGILMREFMVLYRAALQGARAQVLRPLTITYADYAEWQGRWLADGAGQQQLAYWRSKLDDAPALLGLPTDFPRPRQQSFRGGEWRFELDAGTTARLKQIGTHAQCTLFMSLLAVFQGFLARYSGQDDIVIGTPVNGREQPELQDLVGFFVNTLALRQRISPRANFVDLLQSARSTTLEALANQDVPFEHVVDAVKPLRDASYSPLFQTVLVLQPADPSHGDTGGLSAQALDTEGVTSKFDLTLNVTEHADKLSCLFEYRSDLFTRERIERMARHFSNLLRGMLAQPETPIRDLPILDPLEKEHQLVRWNATGTTWEAGSVLDMFAALVRQQPAAIAVEYQRQGLSYAELERQSNRLAQLLRSQGVDRETLVALCLERSSASIVALLAILKAGGCYLPLDPAYPEQRLAYMLSDARPALLLTHSSLAPRFEQMALNRLSVLHIDTLDDACARQPDCVPAVTLLPDALAYVIYTSGSTGRPKGSMLTHAGLANLVHAQIQSFDIAHGRRVLQFAAHGFDASISEIFMALCSGTTLCMADRDALLPGAALENTLDRLAIDTVTLPPVALNEMASERLPKLATLIVAGEACPPQVARHWSPGRKFFNAYGPTEYTVCATIERCQADEKLTFSTPIGRPIANTRIYLLDAMLQPVPVGVPGNLYIAGAGLARAYLGRADMSAERFIPDPFSREAGSRMYASGDVARYMADGRIEFLGRSDSQVKLRGFRIELGEIEHALLTLPGVANAVVQLREDQPGDQRLVAYVAGPAVSGFDPARARLALAARLPDYMVPSHFVVLDTLPLTAHGKIDMRALPEPDGRRKAEGYVAPETSVEQRLCAIWAELLRMDRVGVTDNFFEIGGHSLLATRVISHVRTEFGRELSVRAMFEAPSVRQLSRLLGDAPSAAQNATIARADRNGHLPLSFAQQRLWFLQEMEGPSATYNMPSALRLRGKLDVDALRSALQLLLQRHEILRTRFVTHQGEPRMEIIDGLTLEMPLTVVTAEEIPAHIRRHEQRVFALAQGPLLAVELLRSGPDEHVLLINLHHILCDGWSMSIMADEWLRLYQMCRTGSQAEELPPMQIQYADYALWQRTRLEDGALDRQLAYWTQQLSGAPELLSLPTDRPRPPNQRFDGAMESLMLDAGTSLALRQLSAREGATLFMTMTAGFALLMSRYCGETDILIGTPAANRNRQELEGLIGLFLGNLVLRADLSGQPTFLALMARMRKMVLDAFANGDVPFERIVDALPLKRDLSRNPLFQVFFNMLNLPEAKGSVPDLTVEGMQGQHFDAKFDLTMYAQDIESGIHLTMVYNSGLFDAERIQEMLRQYAQLMRQVALQPDACINDYVILTEEARRCLPDPAAALGQEWIGAVHERFAVRQALHPEAPAIISHERTWSYRELHEHSERIACFLQDKGVQRGDIVAICAARNATVVAAVLGTLKAGAAFMMLDPTYPADHLQACLEATSPSAWLQVSSAPLAPEKLPLVRAIDHYLDLTDIDAQPALQAWSGKTVRAVPITEDDLALIAFTSGSTGKPKAVEGRHGPLTHFLPWLEESFGLDDSDRYSMLSGLAHDPLQRDMFTTLCTGACLHIPHPDVIGPNALAKWMAQQRVTIAHLTPAMAQILAEAEEGAQVPELRYVFLVGDILTRRDVQRLQKLAPSVNVVNYYGSTETQRSVSYYEVSRETPAQSRREVIPLGRGIRDVQLLVLNAAGHQAGIGEHGEIYLRSYHMARGYRGDPGFTAQRFLPNPFTGAPRDRIYRTGDLGRYLPNGMVECLGRADTQVKLRGFRVELGHIESLLGQHDDVREAIVVIRGERSEDKKLIAFVVAQSPASEPPAAKASELRDYLRAKLPDYMQPSAFVFLDALPLTPNGKVNRSALIAPETSADDQAYVAPRTTDEETLSLIWGELLGRQNVSVVSDFFALGGNSLLAVRLTARIERHFGVRLPVSQIFLTPTIAALSSALATGQPAGSLLVPLQTGGKGSPLYVLHPADGGVFHYIELIDALGEERPVFGIQSVDMAGQSLSPYTLDSVALRYADEISSRHKGRSLHLAGWSLGGTIAMRLARILEQRGITVESVSLFDTVYRGAEVRPLFSLENFLESILSHSDGDVVERFGAQHAQLHARIRQLSRDIGIAELENRMRSSPQKLEAELGFDQALQSLILRKHQHMNDNIQLANGFQPQTVRAPIHSFWAKESCDAGCDTQAWLAYTANPAGSSIHCLPGYHADFILGSNAATLAAHLRTYWHRQTVAGNAVDIDVAGEQA